MLKSEFKVLNNIIESRYIKSPIDKEIKLYSITKSSIKHIRENHPKDLQIILDNFDEIIKNPNNITEDKKLGRINFFKEYVPGKYYFIVIENDGRLVTGHKMRKENYKKNINNRKLLYKK